MRIFGYVRVSTDEQAKEGISLDAQKARIEAMALLKCEGEKSPDLTIIEDAGKSAKDIKGRDGVKRLIAHIEAKQVDMLIVYKFDRLSRDTRDSLYLMDLLKKHKVTLITIADVAHDMGTAFGKLMSGMSMLLSEFERNQISERTSNALQFIKKSGCPAGHAPYGWTAQERPRDAAGKPTARMPLIPNVEEQHTIKVALGMRSIGYTFREMADGLNEAGYRTRKGGMWHFTKMPQLLEAKVAE